jgi:hypothetical protein
LINRVLDQFNDEERMRYLSNPIQSSENPDEEKSMVTGDLNTALVEWVVRFGLRDDDVHVKHQNNSYIICFIRSRMFFAGQRSSW